MTHAPHVASVPSRPLALGGLSVILLAFVFEAPLRDVIQTAMRTQDAGYIFIVPLIALYLGWLRRSRLGFMDFKPSFLGVLIVGLGITISLVGYDFDVLVAWHFGGLLAFIGIAIASLGTSFVRGFLPGFLILFAALPVPGQVRQAFSRPLQEFAVSFTAMTLDLLGVSSVQAGNVLKVEGIAMAVGEACDGMRLLVPLGIVIFAFVYSLPLRPSIRLFLIASSIPVVLICNVARLVPTALAYAYLPDYAPMVHDVGGWVSIPLAIVLLLLLLRLMPSFEVPVTRWRLAIS